VHARQVTDACTRTLWFLQFQKHINRNKTWKLDIRTLNNTLLNARFFLVVEKNRWAPVLLVTDDADPNTS
jgi:hypothetical protein